MKYIYLEFKPSGLNDILGSIYRCYKYCQRFNRILLIDFMNTIYKCNLIEILSFKQENIICDSEIIKNLVDSISHKGNITHIKEYPHQLYKLKNDYEEEFLTITTSGWCNSKTTHKTGNEDKKQYPLLVYSFFFTSVIFSKFIRKYCKVKSNLLPKYFTCLQIRNTDRKSDYITLINKNIEKCKKHIYIATDDKNCMQSLSEKFKNRKFINFTEFPEDNSPIHYSNIVGKIQLRDICFDLFVIWKSSSFYTNSNGRFSELCKYVNNNKNLIKF